MPKATKVRASRDCLRRISIIGSSALLAVSLLAFCPRPAAASGFNPVIDEFWIIKNSSEIFRDSFSDGTPPPSGPDDSNPNSTGITYNTFGGAGFVSESGGKLTMDPSLGGPCTPASACGGFTSAVRRFGGIDTSPSALGFADSFEIHGLFDISVATSLPSLLGEAFGIRATDAGLNATNNDRAGLRLRSDSSGNLSIVYLDQDFSTVTSTLIDAVAINLSSASSLELILSKAANSSDVFASYIVDGGAANNLSGSVTIYDGENLTRPEFNAAAAVPLPATLPLMAGGAGVLGLLGWRRKRKTAKAAA